VIPRRALLAGTVAALAAPRIARAAQAITLLVGADPGSTSDGMARAFAPFLERQLPHRRIDVRNIPGKGGLTACRALAAAEPFGGMIAWVATPNLPARIVDGGGAGLMQRIRLLGAVQTEPIVLVCPADSPPSLQEALRRSAASAEALPFGTPAAGTPPHLAMLVWQRMTGTRLNLVTFPSAAAAREAVVGSTVAAAALGLSQAIADLRDGKLAGLGVAGPDGSALPGDLPALPGLHLGPASCIRRGLAAPLALVDPAGTQLVAALERLVKDPDFADQGNARGFAAEWIEGAAWTETAHAQQIDLAKLWEAEPWLPRRAG
jgi:tripartite-type tricarboxylate transporter receptor subunit TctC